MIDIQVINNNQALLVFNDTTTTIKDWYDGRLLDQTLTIHKNCCPTSVLLPNRYIFSTTSPSCETPVLGQRSFTFTIAGMPLQYLKAISIVNNLTYSVPALQNPANAFNWTVYGTSGLDLSFYVLITDKSNNVYRINYTVTPSCVVTSTTVYPDLPCGVNYFEQSLASCWESVPSVTLLNSCSDYLDYPDAIITVPIVKQQFVITSAYFSNSCADCLMDGYNFNINCPVLDDGVYSVQFANESNFTTILVDYYCKVLDRYVSCDDVDSLNTLFALVAYSELGSALKCGNVYSTACNLFKLLDYNVKQYCKSNNNTLCFDGTHPTDCGCK